jgi:hypothetical protein
VTVATAAVGVGAADVTAAVGSGNGVGAAVETGAEATGAAGVATEVGAERGVGAAAVAAAGCVAAATGDVADVPRMSACAMSAKTAEQATTPVTRSGRISRVRARVDIARFSFLLQKRHNAVTERESPLKGGICGEVTPVAEPRRHPVGRM